MAPFSPAGAIGGLEPIAIAPAPNHILHRGDR